MKHVKHASCTMHCWGISSVAYFGTTHSLYDCWTEPVPVLPTAPAPHACMQPCISHGWDTSMVLKPSPRQLLKPRLLQQPLLHLLLLLFLIVKTPAPP